MRIYSIAVTHPARPRSAKYIVNEMYIVATGGDVDVREAGDAFDRQFGLIGNWVIA
jgi:hypothetical protein